VGTDWTVDTVIGKGALTMSRLFTERGGINLKVLVWLLLVFIVVHLGIKLVPMYMDAERMKDDMAVKAGLAQVLKDDEILKDLTRKAKELELPIVPENIILTRDEDNHRMKINAKWDVTVHFFFDVYPPYTTKVYHFDPVVEEDYARKL
jgi:hypothetical protein